LPDQELTGSIIASAGPNKYYNLFRFRVEFGGGVEVEVQVPVLYIV